MVHPACVPFDSYLCLLNQSTWCSKGLPNHSALLPVKGSDGGRHHSEQCPHNHSSNTTEGFVMGQHPLPLIQSGLWYYQAPTLQLRQLSYLLTGG